MSNLVQGLYYLPLDIALYILDGNSLALTFTLNRNSSLPRNAEPLNVSGEGATNCSDLIFSSTPREAEVQSCINGKLMATASICNSLSSPDSSPISPRIVSGNTISEGKNGL
jgi:hypothetical protein